MKCKWAEMLGQMTKCGLFQLDHSAILWLCDLTKLSSSCIRQALASVGCLWGKVGLEDPDRHRVNFCLRVNCFTSSTYLCPWSEVALRLDTGQTGLNFLPYNGELLHKWGQQRKISESKEFPMILWILRKPYENNEKKISTLKVQR